MRSLLRYLFFALALLVVGVVMILPYETLQAIYGIVPGLGRLVDDGNKLFDAVSIPHVVALSILSLLSRLICPSWPVVWVGVGLVIFSSATELVQLWVPGRSVRLADLAGNFLGVIIGLGLVGLLRFLRVFCGKLLRSVLAAIRS